VLHIGLPKTGTSTLQNQVFPTLCSHSGVEYVGKRYVGIVSQHSPDSYGPAYQHITVKNNKGELRDVNFSISEYNIEIWKEIAKNPIVFNNVFFSNESIVTLEVNYMREILKIYRRIIDPVVLLTFRNFDDWLVSLYSHYSFAIWSAEGRFIPPDEFMSLTAVRNCFDLVSGHGAVHELLVEIFDDFIVCDGIALIEGNDQLDKFVAEAHLKPTSKMDRPGILNEGVYKERQSESLCNFGTLLDQNMELLKKIPFIQDLSERPAHTLDVRRSSELRSLI
jgi:hypothetical protein